MRFYKRATATRLSCVITHSPPDPLWCSYSAFAWIAKANFPSNAAVDFCMANDFERRIKLIEDREAIMYQYIDELRAMSVRQEVRIRENEDTLKQVVANQERLVSAQERMDARLQTGELQNRQ